ESFCMALDAETGETVWKSPRTSGPAAYGAPCVYEHADGRRELICCSPTNGISGLDVKTGEKKWSLDVLPLRVVASPVRVGDLVIGQCGVGGNGKVLVAVRPPVEAGDEPRVAFTVAKGAPYVPTPVA